MKKVRCGLMGLILLVLGVALLILIVPTVESTDLGFREYFWAFLIIFFTGMGFGLIMTSILEE
ncbi:MAG: hypothetical protein V2A69_05485 [Pseudomonadota bacterium]